MKEFMTLREFLLLKDPNYPNENRSAHRLGYPIKHRSEGICQDIVDRYDQAKESWEKYGDDGPPDEAEVITLVPGHGGSGGDLRIFERTTELDTANSAFFSLKRKDPSGEDRISLVQKSQWWLAFKVKD